MGTHHRTRQAAENAAIASWVRRHGGTVEEAAEAQGLTLTQAAAEGARELLVANVPPPPADPFLGFPRD